MESAEPNPTLEIVAPFLPRAVLNELCTGRVYNDYRRRRIDMLQNGFQRAVRRQLLIAQHLRENSQPRLVNGLGQWKATIDPLIYFAAREKYGPSCWSDPEFLEDSLRKTPELRAPTPAARFIPVNGFKNTFGAGAGPAMSNPIGEKAGGDLQLISRP